MSYIETALERVTNEKWLVLYRETDMYVRCDRHGMRISVPYVPGWKVPFQSQDAERKFVGKVLVHHAKDYLI